MNRCDIRNVLVAAKAIAERQGRLGQSPADAESGSVFLCAGSCIARAALEATGRHREADRFSDQVSGTSGYDLIVDVFRDCGISPEMARYVIVENDLRAEEDRLQWFMALDVPVGVGV